MALGEQIAVGLNAAHVLVGEHELHARNGACFGGVEPNDFAARDLRHGEHRVRQPGWAVVGGVARRAPHLVTRVDACDVGICRPIAHDCFPLRRAIIKASDTVRAASSILNTLSRPTRAAAKAAMAALCGDAGVSRRPINARSVSRARHGRVATPPNATRASTTVLPSMLSATAAEANAK